MFGESSGKVFMVDASSDAASVAEHIILPRMAMVG